MSTGSVQVYKVGNSATGALASSDDGGHPTIGEWPSGLAHTLKPFTVTLNDGWRVVEEQEQWVLQKRRSNPRRKSTGWHRRASCHTRVGLLLRVRELCGDVSSDAFAILNSLPEDISNH
jgi:hypothetical protein